MPDIGVFSALFRSTGALRSPLYGVRFYSVLCEIKEGGKVITIQLLSVYAQLVSAVGVNFRGI